jgi:signal transduction histidine kinase/ligand-binding sensor domain-containing protein
MYFKTSVLIVFLIYSMFPAFGQVPDMHFTDPLKDLPLTSEITSCIVQDSVGFIWIGTNNGLNCYNGYKINKYRFEVSDSTSLINNTISKLFVDSQGRLWIGTQLGLCYYNKYFDNFISVASEKDYAGLESLRITDINQDNNGALYVSEGSSIYMLDENSGKFKPILKIETGLVNKFKFDNQNNIWIGASDDGGLIFYEPASKKTKLFLHSNDQSNGISNSTVRDLLLKENKLWIATYGGGVNVYDIKANTFKHYPPPDPYAGYITYIYSDNKNNIWICDLTGIKFYDRNNDVFFGYYTRDYDSYSIKASAVAIIQDKQGNYWTIHAPGGVGLSSVNKSFSNYDKNPDMYWHLSEINLTAIEFDAEGNWWMGNGFNGIDIFDWEKGIVRTYHYNESNPYSLGKGGTTCIFRDKNGTMWIGTNMGGLQYYSESKDRFYSYINEPTNPSSIANNDIRSITEDNEGNLWIVTHGKGIDRFNKKEKTFSHFTNINNNLSNDWAFQILFDSNENLWVATAWGLSKLEKGSQKFKNYLSLPTDTNSLCNNLINCLYEDSKNQVWIGTSSGLNRYNPERNNFERFETGLSSLNICGIEDGGGYLWVSTPFGISRLNPQTKEVFNFDESDGLLKGEYQIRSVAANNENMLFFGGGSGLTVFNPEDIKFNSKVPDVLISEFQLNNKPVEKYGEESILKRHISYTREIKLNYSQNVFGFEFLSTNLINPRKNRFKYKMEGVDKDWVESGNKNSASYSNLQPGRYTFKVIASNNDNVWNKTGTSLKIRILPPWWLSWWFKTIAVLAIIIFIYLIFYNRTASLRKQKELLTRKVEERTKNLNDKTILLEKRQQLIQEQSEELKSIAENLEETNNELTSINATKDKLFSIIAHDLKNPFNVILGYTDLLINNFDSWEEGQKLEFLGFIKESSGNAYNLLENLLNWSRSQGGILEFNPISIGANEIINDVLQEVMSSARKKGIEIINLISDDNLKIFADQNMFSLICRNLLMNAIKYSNPGGHIFIDIKDYDQEFIRFAITDHGVGMNKSKAESLFNADNNTSTSGTGGEKGTGLGLILCKEFVTRHKGKIWLESKPYKGTTFFFTIPKSV